MQPTRRQAASALILFTAFMQLASCAHNLEEEYRFSVILDDGYTLHWNFDLEQQTIAFAVNVSTTGWVGFGLSPNGQMPQSDVVIGWVDNDGNTQFHDRFAIDRFLPPIDESQDWFLVGGEEENGYTILEFTRSLTTCDENDLDIKADTAKVIWAYHSIDPVSLQSLGSLRHQKMGSTSLNLLGGSIDDTVNIENSASFVISNENLTIPNKDTTYWCSVYNLPNEVTRQERYIFKFGPVIPESSARYVHHMLVYLCSNLNHTHVGASSECDNANVNIGLCRGGGILFAAWAVGGEEFVYPREVAYPTGGEGNPQYVVLEMHYDNPNEDFGTDLGHIILLCPAIHYEHSCFAGILDSSGIRFTYTDEPPQHRAGALSVGYAVHSGMIIPPGQDDYTITGLCPGVCTNKFIPPEGITVFGNLLHTHIAGHGLIVRQFRQNNECDVLEELQPIDENRQYDFNFQQVTHLPRKVKILPGDSIELQCFYRTTSTRNVTVGGESTREEMCFSFMFYYPQIDLSTCISRSSVNSYTSFAQQYIHPSLHQEFYSSLRSNDAEKMRTVLDQVEWTEEASTTIENLLNSASSAFCQDSRNRSNSLIFETTPPSADCPYEAPDTCSNSQPQTCCERIRSEMPTSAAKALTATLCQFILSLSIMLIIMTAKKC